MHDYSKQSGTRRMRFREWLIMQLDSRQIRGVEWIDREKGLFKIPWKHGNRQRWCMTDAEIFREWAKHSGKYKEGRDVPDPRKWKTNFRCTLNALPDFKEVRGKSSPRGHDAHKIYIMKYPGKSSKTQSERKDEKKIETLDSIDLTGKDIVQMMDDLMNPGGHVKPARSRVLAPRPNTAYPAFESLVASKLRGMPHFPCNPATWFLEAWNAMAADMHVERPEETSNDENTEYEANENGEKENEVRSEQEIIDLVDKMSDDKVDCIERSNEEEDEFPSDQEIIDLVDQMSDQCSSSGDELEKVFSSDR